MPLSFLGCAEVLGGVSDCFKVSRGLFSQTSDMTSQSLSHILSPVLMSDELLQTFTIVPFFYKRMFFVPHENSELLNNEIYSFYYVTLKNRVSVILEKA